MKQSTLTTMLVCISFLLLSTSAAFGASSATQPHITVELISDHTQIKTGGTAQIGVLFKPEEGWHVYWQNPGDTGLAPQIIWNTDSSLSISPLRWPFPESIPVAHLTNYGFHGETLLSAQIQHTQSSTKNLTVSAQLSWLVCKESCVPGNAALDLKLAHGEEAILSPYNHPVFEHFAKKRPKPLATLSKRAKLQEGALAIDIFAQALIFKNANEVDVFIKAPNLVHYAAPLEVTWVNNKLRWKQRLSDYFQQVPQQVAIVIVIDNKDAFELEIPITAPSK